MSSTASTSYYTTFATSYEAVPITAAPPGRVWQAHIGGRRTNIEDMEDTHLLNSIAMVERGVDVNGTPIPQFCYSKLDYLKQEADKRGLARIEDGWDA